MKLRTAYQDDFLIGAALNPSHFCESNAVETAIVKAQFSSITSENVLKWENVHPEPARYDFALPDRYVNFGLKNKMFIVGHTLVWHSQIPDWAFQDAGKPLSREALLQRMHDHIATVMGRYRGKVNGWDVVNEALSDNGEMRDTPWHRIIGDDYVQKAYEFAAAADPQAELYYNDYGLEHASKRAGAIALIKKLRAQGLKITAVGVQGHYGLERPSLDELAETISDFEKAGIKVMITELDVNVLPSPVRGYSADVSEHYQTDPAANPYTNGLPDTIQQQLAQRYADLFSVFQKHRKSIGRVTFWGVTDANSWLNDWPIQGRTSYPLLFDREGQPKPAFFSVLKAAQSNAAARAPVRGSGPS